mmetsp:Transcript_4750/g.11834  ORF Transcript_4750/g.11834 Transcript_4750/m.11834 type:complete len:81 (+) Transcript_4750:860-1102(+)
MFGHDSQVFSNCAGVSSSTALWVGAEDDDDDDDDDDNDDAEADEAALADSDKLSDDVLPMRVGGFSGGLVFCSAAMRLPK